MLYDRIRDAQSELKSTLTVTSGDALMTKKVVDEQPTGGKDEVKKKCE